MNDKLKALKEAFKKLPAMTDGFKKKLIYGMIAMAIYNYGVVTVAAAFGISLPVIPMEEAMKYIFAIVSFGSM
ncbi:hypothetical protein ND363_001645 [Escherichia coli]|nr:hypothetical protein [Escherichia coli]EJI1860923.1 hypothetical protein [Escherichia coli]